MMGPLLRSLCSSTRRCLSSSSSSSYRSTSPFKSSPLQRIPGLNRNFSAAAPASAAVPGRSFDPTRLRNVFMKRHGRVFWKDSITHIWRSIPCGADIPHERARLTLERERGITISKVTSIPWGELELHMVHTPGHAGFGEVERIAGKGVNLTRKNIYKSLSETPSSLDWRALGAVNPIKNQQGKNTCWAFAAIATVEALIFIKKGQLLALSVQQLLDCDRLNKSKDGGGYVHKAYDYIATYGITSESLYPYTGIRGKCKKFLAAKTEATIGGYEMVPFCDEEALLAVVARQPVSVFIRICNGFKMYEGGLFEGSSSNMLDEPKENHFVVIVGYGGEGNNKYWLARNSWGPNWGEGGYIRMKRGVGICGIAESASYPVGICGTKLGGRRSIRR